MVAREDVQKKQEGLEASAAALGPWSLRQVFALLMEDCILCLIKMKETLNLIKIQQFKAFCKLVYNGLHFSGPGVLEIVALVNHVCCQVGNQEARPSSSQLW